MTNLLARLTTVTSTSTQSRRAETLGLDETATPQQSDQPDGRTSIFISPQALTFPIAVGLVKVAWSALEHLPVPALSSLWVPFATCLLIGMLVTVNNLQVQKTRGLNVALGVVVGVLNSMVMFAAVLGIPR